MTDAQRIEDWFAKLPEAWQQRAQRVRELLLEAAPGMEERWMFKSNAFYCHHGWMCFLSLSTDKKKCPQGPQLIVGFCAGARMDDRERLFAPTDHAVIRHFLVPRPEQRFNEAAFRRLLDEAVQVNEAVAEERELKKKKK